MASALRNSEFAPAEHGSEAHHIVPGYGVPGEEATTGRLARAVEGLRALEDDIVATLKDADRTLRDLRNRRIHADAGFESHEQLESRLLRGSWLLRSMRAAIPLAESERPADRRRRHGTPRLVVSERTRRVQGLAALSQGLAHLRTLDERLRAVAYSVRGALGEIETARLYDECGYCSVEDFFERALAPSPILAATLALLAEDPTPTAPAPSESEAAPVEPLSDFSSVSLATDDAHPVNDLTGSADADHQPRERQAPPALPAASASPGSRRKLVLASVVLSFLATVAGGLGGMYCSVAEAAPDTEPAAAAPSAAPEGHAPEGASAPRPAPAAPVH